MQKQLSHQPDTRDCVVHTKSSRLTSTLAASVDSRLDEARVARDLATPPKPALTVDLLLHDPGVVTPAAAEELTALDPGTSRVALTTYRTQRAGLPVQLAKVR